MFKELAGSKVIRQSCVNLLWLLRNRMSELDTYGSVGVLSGNRPFYPDTRKQQNWHAILLSQKPRPISLFR